MNKKFIVPECYFETFLINVLEFGNQDHKHGIGNVLNGLDNNYKNKLGIGIIDNDKNKPPKFQEYTNIKAEKDLSLFKHKERNNYLIVIEPAIEKWLLNILEDEALEITKFGLPNTLSKLTDITKKGNVHKNENIKTLLYTLKQKNVQPFQTLTNWINEIKN